jgi:uncharacterized protein YjbJ (UPF0337 family)
MPVANKDDNGNVDSGDLGSSSQDSGKSVKGEIKEVLGAVTGDRQVEAEGRVAQRVADPRTAESEETDAAVRDQERQVRQAHKDVPAAGAADEGPLGT